MPSWQDYYDLGKATLQTSRPRAQVLEGDVYDAILSGAASMATSLDAYSNRRFRATFLDGAEGEDLTERARDRGVERVLGTQAIGTVTLTRASAAAGAGTIDAGTRVATDADPATGEFQTYTLDEDAVFGALDLTLTDVAATCEVVGVRGNVEEETVVRILDNIFDPTITVSNPGRFAGGEEIESDEDLRDRVRGFFLTQARGTIDALIFGAKEAGATRVSIVVDGSGVVTVYVSDSEGNSSDALVAAVTEELEHWRDAADVVYVTGGVVVPVTITLSLTVRTGVSIPAILTRVRQAVISRVGRLNPGETLYRDMISAAVRDVDREGILGVDIVAPAANVTPDSNEVLRTSDGLVNFS